MISFLLAIILFLPSTALIGSELYLLFAPIGIFLHRKTILEEWKVFKLTPFSWRYLKTFWLILLLVVAIGLLSIIGNQTFKEIITGPVLLFPLTILGAFLISDQRVFKILLVLIAFEILVGISQYLIGTNSFFQWLPNWFDFDNYKSLYHTRVFGLSENSSFLAQKSLIGFLVLLFVKLHIKPFWSSILYTFFLTGIILTFGRTTIMTFAFALVIYLIAISIRFIKEGKNVERIHYYITGLVLGTVLMIVTFFSFWKAQFTRLGMTPRELPEGEGADYLKSVGLENVEMAGRKELWTKAIEFISDNIWFGNYGQRFLVNGKHVHNSFLEYLSTNGIFIFLIMLFVIWLNLKKRNIFFIACVTLYSLGQYGIFWDISFLDIIFFSILLFGFQFDSFEKKNEINS